MKIKLDSTLNVSLAFTSGSELGVGRLAMARGVGIIGAGNIGNALTRRFHALGHEVSIANSRGPNTLGDFARETGAHAVSVQDAARSNDLVVLAIPAERIADLPPGLFDAVPASVPIVDTSNYYPRERDGNIDSIEAGLTESAWVQQQIGRGVVKAFNMIIAAHILNSWKAVGAPGRHAIAIAGDDPKSKRIVMRLIDDIGFDSVDAGSIAESWRQQPGSPVYCNDLDSAGFVVR